KVENRICHFSYSTDGKRFEKIKEPFKAREGKWVGAKVGFFSVQPSDCPDRGWIDVDDFSISR
ncbi:MAG: glycoside hydrolase, partial [Muribaculaceae bacterium]|nr:glycoside hydrolase [Muribaculaceae bacterium]